MAKTCSVRYVDSSIRPLLDRTPREIVLIALGVTCSALSFGHWAEFFTTAGVTLIFALRVPQARPIAVGFCLGWIAAMASFAYHTGWRADTLALDWNGLGLFDLRFILPAMTLLLLTSRDLFERFDAAPERISWLPNVWRQLPRRHWRTMRWCAYSLGILVALVVPGWLWWTSQLLDLRPDVTSAMPIGITAGIVLSLALLVLGRGLGFLIAAAVGITVLITLGPDALSEWSYATTPGIHPAMLRPVCIAALAVTALSIPYTARLVGRVTIG